MGNKSTAKEADELDFVVNCGCDHCIVLHINRAGAIPPISQSNNIF